MAFNSFSIKFTGLKWPPHCADVHQHIRMRAWVCDICSKKHWVVYVNAVHSKCLFTKRAIYMADTYLTLIKKCPHGFLLLIKLIRCWTLRTGITYKDLRHLRFSSHQLPKTQHTWNSNCCFKALQWPWPNLFRGTCFILGPTYGNWNSMLTQRSLTSVGVLPLFHWVVECKALCACCSYKMLHALRYTTAQMAVTTLVVKAC